MRLDLIRNLYLLAAAIVWAGLLLVEGRSLFSANCCRS
jgi:hypothetical protein